MYLKIHAWDDLWVQILGDNKDTEQVRPILLGP